MNTERGIVNERNGGHHTEAHIAAVMEEAIVADLELPPGTRVDPDAAFSDLGLDSAGVVAVSGRVSDALGREVPPESFFGHATVTELARHLAATS
ncbi:acyl carrier protein [Streptomyces niveus]|uniref:acyl carrier protein n=1 Tax=Streptomyces niveus TaxID=193462 RepID=UPI00342C5CD3